MIRQFEGIDHSRAVVLDDQRRRQRPNEFVGQHGSQRGQTNPR